MVMKKKNSYDLDVVFFGLRENYRSKDMHIEPTVEGDHFLSNLMYDVRAHTHVPGLYSDYNAASKWINNWLKENMTLVSEEFREKTNGKIDYIAEYRTEYTIQYDPVYSGYTRGFHGTVEVNDLGFQELTESDRQIVINKRIAKNIDIQTIEFDPKYAGDDQKIPLGNLNVEVEDIKPNEDGKWFVRAWLLDDAFEDVIYTPFIMDKVEDFRIWWKENSEVVERKIYADETVQKLLAELEFRKLPEAERQAIIDECNSLVNPFEEDELEL